MHEIIRANASKRQKKPYCELRANDCENIYCENEQDCDRLNPPAVPRKTDKAVTAKKKIEPGTSKNCVRTEESGTSRGKMIGS